MIAQQLVEQSSPLLLESDDLALNAFRQQTVYDWTVSSGVDPMLFEQTVEIVPDTLVNPYTREVSYPIHEALNWKLTRFGEQARRTEYAALILNDDGTVWQAKLSAPRFDREKSKMRKYEVPVGSRSRAWLPKEMPLPLWQKIAKRFSTLIPDTAVPDGFRAWLIHHPQIPIIVCEGAKKAAALLSLGYAAIALPGVFNGYRKETRSLIDDLQQFAASGRPIYICFDCDHKPKTIENVNLATRKLGTLFEQAGCQVRVIQLPGPEKGVDDLIVARGGDAFHHYFSTASELSFWSTTKYWELTYKPALMLNQPYLGELPFPESGLAFIKSAKGTGKTTALDPLIRQAMQTGRRVLVITHRIQLGKAICKRIGLDWVEDLYQSPTQGLLGYGLCIDSLHPGSQARFIPENWRGAIVIFDELEQIVWHVLNSNTCYDKRVIILETLKELVQTVYRSGGLILGQDADLSDVSIKYLMGLAETITEPWIVINEWKPSLGWDVTFYDSHDPTPVVTKMREVIDQGPVFVCLDAQKVKSRLSSVNLEAYLRESCPDKRILRIDSETVSDPNHPAFQAVERLNEVTTQYDVILATPTIGTGVSLDCQGHFVAVFGIFHGTMPDSEARQALARVRDPVPRYVWGKLFGPAKVGNGSTNYWEVVQSTTQQFRYNLQLLREIDFDLDTAHDPITLRTWAKMAARTNASLWGFQNELRRGLELEGHRVKLFQERNTAADKEVKEAISIIQEQHKQSEADSVSTAPTLDEATYLTLKDRRIKGQEERLAERKYVLTQRYGVPVTPELKLKDDEGWYSKIRLHYYLINDFSWVKQYDLQELSGHLERGQNKLVLQDVKLLGAQVKALHNLQILELLNPDIEIRATDELVQTIVQRALEYRHDVKTILSVTVSEHMTAIHIIQALLDRLGVKLQMERCERTIKRKRLRVYRYVPPDDGRDAVFAVWQQRDLAAQTSFEAEDDSSSDSFSEPSPISDRPDILAE